MEIYIEKEDEDEDEDENIENENGEEEEEEKKYINEEELIFLQKNINNMNKFNQIEILKIIHEDKSIILNENKYGVFINLIYLKQDMIEKLKKYIVYTKAQELSLSVIEDKRKEFKDLFFNTDNNS